MKVILKIVYWTAASGYLLILLGVASGTKVYTLPDILWVCLLFGSALLYLVGSSVLFIRSKSALWRCAAIALVVLGPAALLVWALFNMPNLGVSPG